MLQSFKFSLLFYIVLGLQQQPLKVACAPQAIINSPRFPMGTPNPLLRLLDTNRLTGPNFDDWLRNLRIVLFFDKIDCVLDNPPLKEIQEDASEDERRAFNKRRDDDNKARCYMLASMSNELQKQHLDIENAYEMLLQVQKTCEDLRVKRYNISEKLFRMRMSDESSVHEHAQKMVSYIEQLEKLGAYMSKELAVGLILQSLPDSFSEFITNFNMKKENCELSELVSMLVNAEASITKTQDLVNMKKEDYKLSEVVSMLASADLILQSLPESFSECITNFNMKNEDYNLSELVSMLANAEATIRKPQGLLNMEKEDYKLSEVVSMLASAEATIRKAQCLLLESSESSRIKAKIGAETEMKEVQLKSVIGIEKAELQPEVGITKPHLQLEGSIEKTVLREVNSNEKCANTVGEMDILRLRKILLKTLLQKPGKSR